MECKNNESKISNSTILIVEDDDMTRMYHSIILRTEGFRVVEAKNGKYALNLLNKVKINLILSDINIDNGDGLFLLKEKSEKYRSIPLVFVSEDKIELSKVKAMGGKFIFQKPITIELILDVLLKYL